MNWTFLIPTTHVLELIFRSVAVYVFLVVALRLGGKRELGQLTSFDLVLLLILSNALQNSLNAGDNSLGGGLVSAVTLLVLNSLFARGTYRYPWLDRLLQGRPVIIVTEGQVHQRALEHERITLEELRSALRKQGILRIADAGRVVLEPDGTFTAVAKGIRTQSLEELALPEEP